MAEQKIENLITEHLSGQQKENALKFLNYLNENERTAQLVGSAWLIPHSASDYMLAMLQVEPNLSNVIARFRYGSLAVVVVVKVATPYPTPKGPSLVSLCDKSPEVSAMCAISDASAVSYFFMLHYLL